MLEKADPSSQKQRVSEIKQKYQELSPRSLNWTEVERMHQDLLTVVAIASIGIQNPYQTLELSKLKAQNKKLQKDLERLNPSSEGIESAAKKLAGVFNVDVSKLLRSENAQLREKCEVYEREIKELSNKLVEADQIVNSDLNKFERLKKSNANLRVENSELMIKLRNLKRQNQKQVNLFSVQSTSIALKPTKNPNPFNGPQKPKVASKQLQVFTLKLNREVQTVPKEVTYFSVHNTSVGLSPLKKPKSTESSSPKKSEMDRETQTVPKEVTYFSVHNTSVGLSPLKKPKSTESSSPQKSEMDRETQTNIPETVPKQLETSFECNFLVKKQPRNLPEHSLKPKLEVLTQKEVHCSPKHKRALIGNHPPKPELEAQLVGSLGVFQKKVALSLSKIYPISVQVKKIRLQLTSLKVYNSEEGNMETPKPQDSDLEELELFSSRKVLSVSGKTKIEVLGKQKSELQLWKCRPLRILPLLKINKDEDSKSDCSTPGRRKTRRQAARKPAIEEYFTLTFQAIKLNLPQRDQLNSVNCDELFLKVQEEGVPFNKWHDWLVKELSGN